MSIQRVNVFVPLLVWLLGVCGNVNMCVHTPVFSCLCSSVVFVYHAVSPEPPLALRPPAATCALPSLPSDRLALCREHMIVFESCQDVKLGRSPTRGHVNNKLAISSKVRGNMALQSATLIGSCRGMREWMSPVLMTWIMVKSILLQGETCASSQFHDPYEYYWVLTRDGWKYNQHVQTVNKIIIRSYKFL